ncbi:phosphatidylinositol 4-kinase-like protein type II subunit alpha [Saccharata proteae CBS 121410]|uniref:Phosphatidylinositol 4-kinase n=1 Tax=Saccharata proteae CBS 121410 TaxID=1314787 RepID=A0A6A5YF06_9PEZI|nr:phosphatidylinositol 4-kinase-like protein type II subunit alpha [Saccharata proteae CBS 121410]
MPKGRPPSSGYARIAQAEEEDNESILDESEDDDPYRGQSSLSTSTPRYAPIQPQRHARMQSGPSSPSRRRSGPRAHRSNSGVDIKAINARLERWADEIASKFKIRRVKGKTQEEEHLEIHHSVFQAPEWIRPATAETLAKDYDSGSGPGDRLTKLQFDDLVESVRVAIELGTHPKMISQGSSGSYFARNTEGKVVGVFKPKDEEPYASRNPKWTKWIHRNLFPFFFGRACLIPNLSYISEAAAYVLDTQLRTNLVPYTDIVSLSSKSFYYDFWDRRAYYRKKKPFPEKVGSFQVFLKGFKDANIFLKEHPWPDQVNSGFRTDAAPRKKKRRWAEDCRPSGPQSDDEDESYRPSTTDEAFRRRGFWTERLQKSFKEQLEKLVILDYIMRNTDRGLDNWMIRINQRTQEATIVAEPPKTKDADPYKRQEPMSTRSRSTTPSSPDEPTVSIGAIDNSLSWPWKHPDAWRSYPFGWLFLPVSLIGQPFSEATRRHFLPLLTSKQWWSETQTALRRCFSQDADFKERMYARQIAVMKGQAWNVVETLKTPDHGPLELTRRARVCVWDDLVDIPVAVPLQRPSFEMRRNKDQIQEEQDISTALASSAPPMQHDLLGLDSEAPLAERANGNRFNISRQSSNIDIDREGEETTSGPLSPATVQAISWGVNKKDMAVGSRPGNTSRMSYEGPRRQKEVTPDARRRRFSFTVRRGSHSLGGPDDDIEGDLGYAAAEDMEGNRKKVIVERLETVKSKNPVFTWC